MIPPILDTACQQGFLYALAVFGIVISFRVMNFPDLTVDGSFTLGGAVLATMLVGGYSPLMGLVVATAAGFIAGGATVFLNRKLGISKILSGILIMLMLYSVNLRIMGRANISLLRVPTLFTFLDERGPGNPLRIVFFFGIALTVLLAICYLFVTRLGLFMRATGDNEFMVRCQGVNTNWLYLIGIGLANALVALSGALVVQNQGFADVNMGAGMIITALAALIIGESFVSGAGALRRLVLRRKRSTTRRASTWQLLPWETFGGLFAALVGAFLYFLIIAICLRLGLAPTDLRLATGVLVILGIALRLKGPLVETYARGKL